MLENERTNYQNPKASIEKDIHGWIAKNGGLVATHIAVLLFGLVGLFAKVVALPAIILVLGRTFFSSAFLGAYLTVKRQKFALKTRGDYVLIVFAGIILAMHWTSFMQSIQVSTVAVGTLTLATFPLFSAVLEPLLFHEKMRVSDIACALVMLGGVACIVDDFSLEGPMAQGVLWGLLSAFTYALLSLANRKFSSGYPASLVSFYEQATATVVLLPALFVLKPSFTALDIGMLAIMGIVFTAIAHTLFIGGLRTVKVRTAGIITGLESVYGIVAALLFLGEIPGIREVIGGAIILAVALYSTLASTRSN
ncbi:DMT family transporter [Slackia piriformis]|uniref:DMT family transporter n=1 Tax=Slackia piriformis TaxID=626934 RepID=UPI0023F2F587|nr:DMT family transporter [Slackia piriformis]